MDVSFNAPPPAATKVIDSGNEVGMREWTSRSRLLGGNVDRAAPPTRGIRDGILFLCDFDPKAIEARPIPKLARNAVDTNELFITNLEVPDDRVIGEVGKGMSYLFSGLNPERIVVAYEMIGLGKRFIAQKVLNLPKSY